MSRRVFLGTLGIQLVYCAVGLYGQNVGVGTTTPSAKLHIEVPSGFTSPVLQVNQQGSATPYLIVQPDGKVGIGVATPSEALDVSGNVQFSGALMPGGSAGSAGQVLVSQGPGSAPTWQTVGSGGGIAGICTSPSANYLQKWTGSELCNSIIYDDGQFVGIGVSTPVAPLQISTHIYFDEGGGNVGSGPDIRFSKQGLISSEKSLHLNFGGSDTSGLPSKFYIRYGSHDVSAQPYFTITDLGNVGIGTTSPQATLQIKGYIYFNEGGGNAAAGPDIRFNKRGLISSDASMYINFGGSDTGGVGSKLYIGYGAHSDSANILVTVEDSGNVGIGTTSPTERLDVSGNVQFSGALMPGGSAGSAGQVLVSQGPGSAPVWTNSMSLGSGIVNNWTNLFVDTLGNEVSCAVAQPMTLYQCVNACLMSNAQGFSDWIIPTIDEVDDSYRRGTMSGISCNKFFWTGTSFRGNFSSSWITNHYIFNPFNAAISYYGANDLYYCRCVR